MMSEASEKFITMPVLKEMLEIHESLPYDNATHDGLCEG